jgi:hypothetical protein
MVLYQTVVSFTIDGAASLSSVMILAALSSGTAVGSNATISDSAASVNRITPVGSTCELECVTCSFQFF